MSPTLKTNQPKINISILEDHQGVIDGYKYRLQGDPQLNIAGIAMVGADLEPMLAANPTDVLILDINVPVSRSDPRHFPILHTLPGILKKYPELAILVISFYNQAVLIDALITVGVRGYVIKNDSESIEHLNEIIPLLKAGGAYYSKGVNASLQQKMKSQTTKGLTPGQVEVLGICLAYPDETSAELAKRMGIAASTFRNQLSACYRHLKVKTRSAAIARMQASNSMKLDIEPGEEDEWQSGGG